MRPPQTEQATGRRVAVVSQPHLAHSNVYGRSSSDSPSISATLSISMQMSVSTGPAFRISGSHTDTHIGSAHGTATPPNGRTAEQTDNNTQLVSDDRPVDGELYTFSSGYQGKD